MDLLIQVHDTEASFLVELLKKFDFVKVQTLDNSPVLEGLERSIKQMNAMRNDKLRKPSITELFDNE